MNVALRPQPRTLDYISLCTGGGGLELGVELAIPNARPVVLVEGEAFAVAHLVEAMQQGLLAPAPVWSDARTFNGRPWRGLVDGVIGGIPCQPHSLAGKRLGEEDERDLWSPARRILVQSGAWWILIENVGGMLSSGGAERVWRGLQRLDFQVEGGLFTASETGWPHERERLFILGVADARRAGRSEIARSAYGHEGTDARRAAKHNHQSDSQGEGVANADDFGQRRESYPCIDARGLPGEVGEPVVHTVGCDCRGRPDQSERRPSERIATGRPGPGRRVPPGPDDADGWRDVLARAPHLEPAVRRMADGLAPRVDQLRLLGNGVHPLEGGYALRSLATDLARRSAGAAELLRMMEPQQ